MLTNFKKKQKSSPVQRMFLGLGGIAMLLVVAGLAVADIHMYRKRATLNLQVESLKAKKAELEARNGKLETGISEADNVEYVEKVAREELDLQKPGESVVSFIVPEDTSQHGTPSKQNMLQVWMGWVAGIFVK